MHIRFIFLQILCHMFGTYVNHRHRPPVFVHIPRLSLRHLITITANLFVCVWSENLSYLISYLVWLASGIVVYTGGCPVLGQYAFWRRTELRCKLKGYTRHHALWDTHGLTWVIRSSFVTGKSYTPTLYPPNWITFCWFCYTAADWNVLLWIYMMWCYLGQLSLSGRIQCGVIRLPCVQTVFASLLQGKAQYHSLYMHGT